ncbi:MAG: endonuclease MutS2 [Ruminococcaceae bacterium]|nr:endonuclease MutS2 [Oscillospiraceae bacterium]
MSTIYEKSILTLELPQVLEKIAQYAVSEGAKERVRAAKPYRYLEDIRISLTEITDAQRLMSARSAPTFSGLQDVTVQLRRVEIGGTLGPAELLRVAELLRCARATAEYGDPSQRRDGLRTSLDHLFAAINTNKFLEDRITSAILSEEEIADSASPELASIRRQIRAAHSRVREVLNRIISSQSYSKYLQESLITQRGGRFVVPVKAEFRSEISGLVHDVSASGATLFVEPSQVVEANNEIRVLTAKEEKEIERILAELSNEVGNFSGSIADDIHVLTILDAIFAKAQYSLATDSYAPQLSDDLIIDLKRARHPLLEQKTAVPIDVHIGEHFNTLVITGPNTGGKTVALKTLGLLTLMVQCGLHIPAEETSTVSLFTRIFADIGDEQSISQSLSTFSSHMSNIVGILEELDDRSLTLFDELGAGTDPTEGAALAMSIIEHVRSQGSLVAATTHYAELKMFAISTDGVENAACEFDVETLKPTYRLLIGVPGKSNAFAISKRLGLDERIIDAARESLTGESVRFEDVLTDLDRKRQTMERELALAARSRMETDKIRRDIERREAELERQREKILEDARRQALDVIADARAASDAAFDELAQLKKEAAAAQFAIDVVGARAKHARRLNEASSKANPNLPKVSQRKAREIHVGDIVAFGSGGTHAEVLTEPDKNGNVTLQAGIMTMTVKANTLTVVEEDAKREKVKFTPAKESALLRRSVTKTATTTLDLRGMMSDEAVIELERFLDAAQMAKLSPLTVIHGKGTGALRTAVQQYLKRDRRIASFRPGRYGEGEAGVTVIELK